MKAELVEYKGCGSFGSVVLPCLPHIFSKVNVYCRPSCETVTYTVHKVSFLYDQYAPDEPARVFIHVTKDTTH